MKNQVYKPSFLVPGGPQPYISSCCQGWVFLGFGRTEEATSLDFLNKCLEKLYFRKFRISCICSSFWHPKYRATFTQEKSGQGLDAFCGTRFSLTELVFNWCLDFERNSLRTISSYFVKFCDVHGKTNEFVFRNRTTLLTVVNIDNIVKGLVLLIYYCSHVWMWICLVNKW